MNCRKARKWICADIDGELSVRRKEQLYNHIRRCPACVRVRDRWLSLGDHLRSQYQAAVPSVDQAWSEISRRLAESSLEEEGIRWFEGIHWLRWAVAAGLALLVGLGAWTGYQRLLVTSPSSPGTVEWLETSLPGATSVVYEDHHTGLLIIWVMEPNGGGHVGT